jgi:iron complex transport system ATP-binding protein
MAMLTLDHVTVGYDGKPVLRDVSLRLTPGQVLGVVGPNGVGKSTLLKVASGVLAPFEGDVLLEGEKLAVLPPARRARVIAVVAQALHLPETFPAIDVVLMGRTPYLGWLGSEGDRDYEIALEAMTKTGTDPFMDRKVGELSGGEQQRVLIARALAQSPRILLLDEPTAHLDLKHQEEVLSLVRSLALEQGLAVMITLHDLNLVARFADTVALLSNGAIRKVGAPADVLTPDELASVYGLAIQVMDHPIHGTPLVLS